MSITLRSNDSINLTTGVVTRSDQRAEIISYPSRLAAALRRNNLRALHLAFLGDMCGWTPEACHRSQQAHGRGDDCGYHPWASTPRYQAVTGTVRLNDWSPSN